MKEYITELRKQVGRRPIIMCGASVMVFNDKYQVLMLQRSDNQSWCFPGGAMELGESLQDTAKREVYEETGLEVEELTLFNVFSGKDTHYIYPNGDEVYNINTVYLTSSYRGNIKLDSEGLQSGFFSINQLPRPVSPPEIPVVRELIDKFGKM